MLACLSSGGCASAPSQLVVRIDSDLPTDAEPPVVGDRVLRAVHVLVCEPSCDRPEAPRVERRWSVSRDGASRLGRVQLPLSFGVAPSDPARLGRVEIRVEALRVATDTAAADDVLFATTRFAAFAPNVRVEVPIFLAATCLGAECPAGTACDDEGQCAPIEIVDGGGNDLDAAVTDAWREDAGVGPLDAWTGLADASSDASPRDASREAGPDANVDASCSLVPEPFPTSLVAEAQQGFSGGYVSATAAGEASASLAAGVFVSSTTFTWEGASAMGPTHFVSRVTSGARWTTFARAVSAFSYNSRIRRIGESAGIVYAAGTRVESWSISSGGTTLTLPPVPSDDTEALRTGVVVLALDAASGRPLWAHTLTTGGAGDYLGGLAVDDDGATIAWRTLPSATSTIGALSLDGTTRPVDRGPFDGRVRLARFDRTGTLLHVHAIGGASFSSVDLVRADGNDQVLSMHVSSYLAGHSTLDGLDPPPPDAELVVLRLDVLGDPRWSTGVRCTSGDWAPGTGVTAYANGRIFTAFVATTPASSAECRMLGVGDGSASDATLARGETGATWIGVVGIEACSGALASPTLFSLGVNGTPAARVEGIVADGRSVALTGYVGSGGFVTSSGTLAGRDPGTGTDGFLFVVTPALEPRYTLVFGSRTTVISGADDYGAAIGLVDTSLYLALGLTASQTVDTVTIATGARLVRFGLR